MVRFCIDYGIVPSHSSNYYPWDNGLVESSKKNILKIIKKIIKNNREVGTIITKCSTCAKPLQDARPMQHMEVIAIVT
jgi:hypothetical protein